MKNITYEVAVNFGKKRTAQEALIGLILQQAGIKPTQIVEKSGIKPGISLFTKSPAKALALKNKISGLKIKNISLNLISLKDRQWQTKWKENFRATNITKNIRIIPLWLKKDDCSHKPIKIFLDTNLAFGTGLHPTTKFTARFIESKKNELSSFCDIGTGTGILSLIALKLGAKEIWAIDINKESIRTAAKNAAANNYRFNFLKYGDFAKIKINCQFDFVAANILTEELIKMREKIVARIKPGKYLAVSGISLGNYKRFRKEFDGKDLRCLKVKIGEGWCGVLYKKMF